MISSSRTIRFLFTLVLIPFLYLSAARLAGQLVVSTDNSMLFRTDLTNALFDPLIPELFDGRTTSPHPSDRTAPTTRSGPLSDTSPRKPYDLVLSLDPFNADCAYLAGQQLLEKDTGAAEKIIFKALRMSVIDPKTWVIQGWIEGRKGSLTGAEQMFERAAMLAPTRADSYAQQGLYLYQLWLHGDQQQRPVYEMSATLSLIKALELDRSLYLNPHVNTAMAELYAADRESNRFAVGILGIIPEDRFLGWPMTIRRMALFVELQDGVRALSLWRHHFDPKRLSADELRYLEAEIGTYKTADMAYFLAQVHLAQGNYHKALAELSGLASFKESAEYKIALASVYEHMGNRATAGRLYEEALRLSPSNQEAKGKVIEYFGSK